MSTYSQLLKDPRWQRRRLEILQRSSFTCETCGAADKTLHVHHKIYRKSAKPWEYKDHELDAICEDCHEKAHHIRARLDAAIAALEWWELGELIGYAQGMKAVAPRPAGDDASWTLESIDQAIGFASALLGGGSELAHRLVKEMPVNQADIERIIGELRNKGG